MTLVKIDHPRRIDQFLDYFGEPCHATSNEQRYGGVAVDPSEPHGGEAASESMVTARAFDLVVLAP